MWTVVVSAAKIRQRLRDTNIPQHEFRRIQKELRMIMTKWEENNTRQGPYATSLQNFSTANSSKPTDVLKEVFLAMNAKHARYSQYLTQIWEGCRQQAGLLEISEGLMLVQTIPLDLPPRAPTPALAAAPPAPRHFRSGFVRQ